MRGRLWRATDPGLDPDERERLVHELMSARRAKAAAMRSGDADAREEARRRVDAAKVALGERGPVWWHDGEPDLTRRTARTSRYADWYAEIVGGDAEGSGTGGGTGGARR
ncbi:biopolymer transporter Tol [Actinotalea sp. AC32]|nr:biopolymer transporter Tol [Actinotalea sp. AC32]